LLLPEFSPRTGAPLDCQARQSLTVLSCYFSGQSGGISGEFIFSTRKTLVRNRNKGETPLQLRQRLGFNQNDFWSRVGVTQSAGSRYESGALPLPLPIRMLIELVYGDEPRQALERLREDS
jgi:hypothetical protein